MDCDLMRYPDSGLYHYCLNLGRYMHHLLQQEGWGRMGFYTPNRAAAGAFQLPGNCIPERKWHRKLFRPFLWDCDIWHAPFQSGRIIPEKNKRVKVVLTIHDLNFLHEGKPVKEQQRSLQKTRRLVHRADALVCISQHCKEDVLANIDVEGKPVYVIHNGTHYVAPPPPVPERYHPQRPFIYTMGYVNRKKNMHTLVPLLQKNDYELVIAGKLDEPDYVQKIKKQALEWGVSERVHILGPVSENDKAWYLKHCTAFALVSLAEGFGAPVVEAMQFGKPLFLSALTSLPEIGGDAAFY
ncbi:MAG: glycosyltransferase family 4 protein, partial [Dinghuibacter sp.]|nr:glycosyltransferase family 4 protein [Dinghuibacter sp.]